MTEQVILEELMSSRGRLRFDSEIKRNKDNESSLSYGNLLLKQYALELSKKVHELLEDTRAGKAGTNRAMISYITGLDDMIISYTTLKTVIDSLLSECSVTNLSDRIGTRLEYEVMLKEYEAYCKENDLMRFFDTLIEKVTRYNTERQKFGATRVSISHGLKEVEGVNYNFKFDSWTPSIKGQIGIRLLNLVCSLGFCKTILQRGAKRSQAQYMVVPSEQCMVWIKDLNLKLALLAPLYMPCVIPPKPWTEPRGGGYYTLPPIDIIKARSQSQLIALKDSGDLSNVYKALNIAQDTGWRINKEVLKVIKYFWNSKIELPAVYPEHDDVSMPRCSLCGAEVISGVDHKCLEENEEALKQWKREAFKVHTYNNSLFSRRLLVQKIFWIAGEYEKYDEFFYPYQLDYRGRLYPLTSFLSPQGTDIAKGLLEFSEGKPVGEGERWLKIHLANTHGEDKLSFDDRVQWTEDNMAMILSIGSDPYETVESWANSDSPVCFLAACIDFYNYKSNPETHLSHIAVAQDGTCSGLQHYSAILRDAVGGSAVNLVPHDKPSDIYRVVAEQTILQCKGYKPEDVDEKYNHYELAQQWLASGLINRKCTKRSVMTLPYGSTFFSCMEYVKEYIMEQPKNNLPWTDDKELKHACVWLSRQIWTQIGNTVIAARQGMDWLHRIGKTLGRHQLPTSWVAPSGLPIVQPYVDQEIRHVQTYLQGGCYVRGEGVKVVKDTEGARGTKVTLYLNEDTDRIDARKQGTGLAPNFIHSMDASALVFAVLKCNEEHQVHSFALIHDSFGTHACDSQKLADDLRLAFVEMYEQHSVFDELLTRCKDLLPDVVASDKCQSNPKDIELPDVPPMGELDIRGVLKSEYFFA